MGSSDGESVEPLTRKAKKQVEDPDPLVFQPLAGDAYSAVTIGMCKVCDSFTIKQQGMGEHVPQFLIALSTHFLSVGLQFLLIYWLMIHAVRPRIEAWDQFDVAGSHTNLTNAISTNQALNQTDATVKTLLDICERQQANHAPWIFLWLLKMLTEVWGSCRMVYISMVVPRAKRDGSNLVLLKYANPEKLTGKDSPGRVDIVGFSLPMKLVTLLIVSLPKLILAVLITIVGCEFLMYAPTLTDLVMKSLALGFLATLDELVFTALAPAKFVKEVTDGFMAYSERKYPLAWHIWGSFVAKLCLAIVALIAFTNWPGTKHIVDFRHACRNYESAFNVHSDHVYWLRTDHVF